jgi:hypothetical protein
MGREDIEGALVGRWKYAEQSLFYSYPQGVE